MPEITCKEDLKQNLDFVFNDESVLEFAFYVILKDKTLLRLDLEDAGTEDLIPDFKQELKRKLQDEEYEVQKYSQADERKGYYYVYDLDEKPEIFDVIESAGVNRVEFFSKQNTFKDIVGLVTLIKCNEEYIRLYRPVYGVDKTFTKDRRMYIFEDQTRFVRLTENILNIIPTFTMIQIGDQFVITDLEKMEKNHKLTDVIINHAKKLVNGMAILDIVEDLNYVSSLLNGDPRLARKVVRTLSSSRVLRKGIPKQTIIEFAKRKVDKIGKIPINEDEIKFSPTHKTEVERFIKLLSDDLLISELTKTEYDSPIKDEL